MYRGSRKHILDWLERPLFGPQLLNLVSPVDVKITHYSTWAPRGYQYPDEARLEKWRPEIPGSYEVWNELENWWLKVSKRANTPNWDLAFVAEIEGKPGLVLIEAKANRPELSDNGKKKQSDTNNSRANHEQIKAAIESANTALEPICPDIRISLDNHYQLSNRIAYMWKVASLGVPVVLVYLGFLGDNGIENVGTPFVNEDDWNCKFKEYLKSVGAENLLDKRHQQGGAPFWLLSREREVLEQSPCLKKL